MDCMENKKIPESDKEADNADKDIKGMEDPEASDNEQTADRPEKEIPVEADAAIANDSGAETEDVQSLKNQLQKREKEVAGLQDQFLRMQAETDNFRKRMIREKNDFSQYANERLIKELIPICENLDRALAAPDTNPQSLKEGVEMIFKQFTDLLKKEKVKSISSLGEKFDPAIHEALSQIETDEHEENTVVQEISKAFFLNDRLLRPAKVIISKKPVKSKAPKKNGPAPAQDHAVKNRTKTTSGSAETVPPKSGRPQKRKTKPA